MTASPWSFPFSDAISLSLSSSAYGPSDWGKNRHCAKKVFTYQKSSWNLKNSYRSSYPAVLSLSPLPEWPFLTGPCDERASSLWEKLLSAPKPPGKPLLTAKRHLKWSLCLSKPHLPSGSKGHSTAGLVPPSKDWVTAQPHLAGRKDLSSKTNTDTERQARPWS